MGKQFWLGLLERALKTFIQTFVAVLGVTAGVTYTAESFRGLPWESALITASVAAVLSIATSFGNPSFVAGKPKVAPVDMDADTRDACQETLWNCNLAEHPDNNKPACQAALDELACLSNQALTLQIMANNIIEAIYNHRDNYPGIIQRNIVDQAENTLAECALLQQTLEDTLDDNL